MLGRAGTRWDGCALGRAGTRWDGFDACNPPVVRCRCPYPSLSNPIHPYPTLSSSSTRAGMHWDALGHAGTCWDALGRAGTCWDMLGHAGIVMYAGPLRRIARGATGAPLLRAPLRSRLPSGATESVASPAPWAASARIFVASRRRGRRYWHGTHVARGGVGCERIWSAYQENPPKLPRPQLHPHFH